MFISYAKSNKRMIDFINALHKNRNIVTLGEQAHWNFALKYNNTITTTFLSIKLFPCGDEFYIRSSRIFYNDLISINISLS